MFTCCPLENDLHRSPFPTGMSSPSTFILCGNITDLPCVYSVNCFLIYLNDVAVFFQTLFALKTFGTLNMFKRSYEMQMHVDLC